MTYVTFRKVFSTAGFILAASAAMAQWPQMATDTLTSNTIPDETVFKSLDIDDMDSLHLIWRKYDNSGDDIIYARKACYKQWSAYSTVNDTAFDSGEPFIGVDKNSGVPYVAYIKYTTAGSEVILAHDSAGTWVRQQLTNTAADEYSPSVAIDGAGKAHVAWIGLDQQSSYKIFYSTDLSGSWVTQMLTGSNLGPYGSGAQPYIAVDSAGVAYIAYRGGNYQSYRVHLANNTSPGGITWNYQITTTPNSEDMSGSIWVEAGMLYLMSSGNDGWGFPVKAHYSEWDIANNLWTAAQQVSTTTYGEPSPIFVDNAGYAHVMINQISGNLYTGDIYYTSNTSGSWVETPVSAQQETYNGSVVVGTIGQKAGAAYHESNYSIPSHEVIVWTSGSCESVPTGIIEEAGNELNIYPNPSAGVINISLGTSSIKEIGIIDMLGKQVISAYPADKKSITISADKLSKGVYLLRIQTTDGSLLSRKLLIE